MLWWSGRQPNFHLMSFIGGYTHTHTVQFSLVIFFVEAIHCIQADPGFGGRGSRVKMSPKIYNTKKFTEEDLGISLRNQLK